MNINNNRQKYNMDIWVIVNNDNGKCLSEFNPHLGYCHWTDDLEERVTAPSQSKAMTIMKNVNKYYNRKVCKQQRISY